MRRALIAVAAVGAVACGGHAHAPRPRESVLRAIQDAPRPPPTPMARLEVLPASASKVTFPKIAKIPEPGWSQPRNAQFSADGKLVTFLASEGNDEVVALHAFDLATGSVSVLLREADLGGAAPTSRDEELRRERQRELRQGITQYEWAKKAPVLVVSHGGDVYARDAAGAVKALTKTPEPEIDAHVCDTGERVAFVRKGDLFSVDVATGKETALTTGATEGLTHGLSDFNAQEEMGEPNGYFWSPKCDRIAYLEVDERAVEKIPVLGYRNGTDLMMQRYPEVGKKNPQVRIGIVDVATKKTAWVTPPGDPKLERYNGRFTWAPDGASLYYETIPRDQKRVALNRVDPKTGKAAEIAAEDNSAWVHFEPVKVLERSGQLIYATNKTGHRHLELLSAKDGTVVRTLTKGDWDVESIAGFDEAAGRVLFTATKESPLERHLYAVKLDGGDVEKLTSERGVHHILRVDEGGQTWVDVHSAHDRPPQAVVARAGKSTPLFARPVDPEIAALDVRPFELITVPGADGTPLSGSLLKPRELRGRHPAIVMVYGGPESQLVEDAWAPHLLWQHLADRGFVILQVDNRGTGGRGSAFAQKVHKRLGQLELQDQLAAAQYLSTLPYVDASRLGIYGHSYGGFMAALAMLDGNGTFQVGVAGSPVTDWRLYDSGYTERYMETPDTNPDGYAASDLSKKVAGLTGKLLVTHALMDENVHYAHTAKLVDALINADKRFDLFVLPGERHGVRAPAARAYMPERIASYFADNL